MQASGAHRRQRPSGCSIKLQASRTERRQISGQTPNFGWLGWGLSFFMPATLQLGGNEPLVTQSARSTQGTKVLCILLAATLALVVALVAGILVASTGVPLAEAFLYGGGAFAVSMTLFLAVLSAVGLV